MIGIKRISSHVPPDFVDNVAQGARFGESSEFIETKIGAVQLARRAPTEDTSDLAVSAVRRLLDASALTADAIDALVVVTQNGDGHGLPHTSALVQHKLGLPTTVAAFDVSLGCSGYVYGLFLLKGFLEASGLQNGVLVTADPYSKIIDPDDRVTSLLFGDAATATWLGEDPAWQLGQVLYGTDGSGAGDLHVVDGRLKMNGRQVFNFAFSRVPPHIRQVLERSGLTPAEIDLYVLHQGSAAILDAVARKFGEASGKFVREMRMTGNTVSSSIPLILESRLDDDQLSKICVSGFGVGLSWASAILTRTREEVSHRVD